MNILFIFSLNVEDHYARPLQGQDEMQFGISYISSLLKQNGHETMLIVLTRDSDLSDIDARIQKFSPELICFTSTAIEYEYIKGVAGYIKGKYPDIFLLIGGVHVSLNPEISTLEIFDALCVGEGEFPTLELVTQLQSGEMPSDIPNLWIKQGNEVQKNHTRPFHQELDTLPFPDRSMWQEWIQNRVSRHAILLGRGCPFNCTYCCNHAIRKLSDGKYVRFRLADNIIEEIREIATRFYQVEEIYLEVETIGASGSEWVSDLCNKLHEFNQERETPITFGVNFRITKYYAELEKLFKELRNANVRYLNIGLESGSEKVRRTILRRNYSNEDLIKTVKLARQNDLKVNFYNLIGLPGERNEDFAETIAINRICQPDFNYLSIFFPYPGSVLYEICKEKEWIEDISNFLDKERINSVLDMPDFSKEEIERGFIWFEYQVKRGIMPFDHILNSLFYKYNLVHGKGSGKVGRHVVRDILVHRVFLKDVVSQMFKNGDFKILKFVIKSFIKKA